MRKFILLFCTISFVFVSCKLEPIVPTGVQDVKIGKLDMLKGIVDLSLGLKINNPNSFNVCIYHLDLDVTVAGVSLGKVAMDDKVKIKKHEETVYPITVHAELKDLLTNIPKIVSAIKNKESNVKLVGEIRVGSGIIRHTFPVKVDQDKVSTTQN